MVTYIALLRGINVGGKNKLPMKDLTMLLNGLGLDSVRTYIQSGNVVFQSVQEDTAHLSREISAAINRQFGFEPLILLLRLEEFAAAVAANPFPDAAAEPKSLHFFFLSANPENPNLDAIGQLKAESEEFQLLGNVFYLYAPEGIGRSRLAASAERLIGVPVTARNWRSVTSILDLAAEEK